MVTRFVTTLVLLLALPVSAAQAGLLAFKSPTGNITCVISTRSGGFAQCELRSMPHRGGFFIPLSGRVARYDVSRYDDLAGQRFVLGYGGSRSLGRFTCTSRFSGMTCRNRVSGHGFTISRQRQRVF